jgi:hypothetical protein
LDFKIKKFEKNITPNENDVENKSIISPQYDSIEMNSPTP